MERGIRYQLQVAYNQVQRDKVEIAPYNKQISITTAPTEQHLDPPRRDVRPVLRMTALILPGSEEPMVKPVTDALVRTTMKRCANIILHLAHLFPVNLDLPINLPVGIAATDHQSDINRMVACKWDTIECTEMALDRGSNSQGLTMKVPAALYHHHTPRCPATGRRPTQSIPGNVL